MSDETSQRADTRTRIVDAAARVLREEGPAAVTTRRVALDAGVQPPAIYRFFGDKEGLLEAVAERVLATYVSTKAATVEAATHEDVDPVDELRSGWQSQIDFNLANPALFRLLSDPARAAGSPATQAGLMVLRARVHRIAEVGRLRVSEQRAVGLIQTAGVGAVETLLSTPPEDRDHGLVDSVYEAVLQHILTDAPDTSDHRDDAAYTATVAFRAISSQLEGLSEAEHLLLGEWLDRSLRAR